MLVMRCNKRYIWFEKEKECVVLVGEREREGERMRERQTERE